MGTSGAYGGSGSAAWAQAHDLYAQAGGGGPGDPPPVQEVVAALAAAMRRANRRSLASPGSYTAAGIAPARPRSSDGYTHSRTAGGASGSTSGFGRRAARGAAAVSGAQAYRARDRRALAELGLDLAALESLPNDRARCAAIAAALLGAPAHPDDAALNAASVQTMMDVLRSKDPTDSERFVEMFTENLAYEQVLVELTSKQRTTPIPSGRAARIEKQVKKYIRNSMRTRSGTAPGTFAPQAMIDRALRLASKVLGIFGGAR